MKIIINLETENDAFYDDVTNNKEGILWNSNLYKEIERILNEVASKLHYSDIGVCKDISDKE